MNESVWTTRRVLQWSRSWLAEKNFESPRLDAELLLADALSLRRIDLFLDLDRPLSGAELQEFKNRLRRRARYEPVAYIIGRKDFWKYTFTVNQHVLVPRPESELLVETILRFYPDRTVPLHLLEIGVGSGAVLLSLLSELPQAQGVGVDVSTAALQVAADNALCLKLTERVVMIPGDLTAPLNQTSRFDVILSNPPYIAKGEWAGLAPDVREWEPEVALYGGLDGLDVHRKLIPQTKAFLKAEGLLAVEMGYDQSDGVMALFLENGFKEITVHRDYSGHSRVISGVLLEI